MENASKALIIAGAILLSILIIGLGMFIYTQAAGAMSGANLDPQKVAAYNSQFEQYEGTKSGTQVRALCDLVRNHNNGNINDETLQINIVTNAPAATTTTPSALVDAATINGIKQSIRAGATYDVTFSYDVTTGYIVEIGIQRHDGTNI